MLLATHNAKAPWTLVNFNHQRRGRLALIRHLLAQVPDVQVPPDALDLPPLSSPPQREHLPSGFKVL